MELRKHKKTIKKEKLGEFTNDPASLSHLKGLGFVGALHICDGRFFAIKLPVENETPPIANVTVICGVSSFGQAIH